KYASWQFAALAGLADTLDARNSSLSQLAEQSDEELRAALGQLASLFDAARAAVKTGPATRSDVLQAARLLGRGIGHQEEDAELLATLLAPQNTDVVQNAAAAALGRLKSKRIPEMLLKGWKSYSPGLRSNILDTLFLRDDWLAAVLDSLDQKQILPLDIDAARRQRLLQHKTDAVRRRAARLLAGSIDADRQKVVEAPESVLGLKREAASRARGVRETCGSGPQL